MKFQYNYTGHVFVMKSLKDLLMVFGLSLGTLVKLSQNEVIKQIVRHHKQNAYIYAIKAF